MKQYGDSIIKITCLTQHKEITPVYSENDKIPIKTLWVNAELLNVKIGGTYSYHSVLKCSLSN